VFVFWLLTFSLDYYDRRQNNSQRTMMQLISASRSFNSASRSFNSALCTSHTNLTVSGSQHKNYSRKQWIAYAPLITTVVCWGSLPVQSFKVLDML